MSVARSLDQIGDWWTLLVVREVMYGVHQFNEMRASLGISRAVLTTRLAELIENGILQRLSDPTDGRAAQYHLTQKGLDLWPVIIALLNWSNQHVLSDSEDVVKPFNPASGQPIKALCARDTAGNITPKSNGFAHRHIGLTAFKRSDRESLSGISQTPLISSTGAFGAASATPSCTQTAMQNSNF